MKVCVFGGTGFIGRRVVRQLATDRAAPVIMMAIAGGQISYQAPVCKACARIAQ